LNNKRQCRQLHSVSWFPLLRASGYISIYP
jgi:hypothetical protein